MLRSTCAALVASCLALAAAAAIPAAAKDFTFAGQSDFRSMDPHGFYEGFTLGMNGAVYEGLDRINRNLEVEPALAEKWEQKEPKVWIFHLREGVVFHDGTPLTADDVVFSLKRAGLPGSDVKPSLQTIVDIKKVDDMTVEIDTDEPNPILPRQLAVLYIMSGKWSKANGAEEPSDARANKENYAALHANGTGPYMLEDRQPGQKTIFDINPKWWDKPTGNVTKVIFTPISSPATRVAALLGGQVDMIDPVPVQDIPRVKETQGFKVTEGPELRTLLFAMDVARDELQNSSVKGKNPLKDKRVRQAMSMAIDEAAIIRVVMHGAATPAGLLVGPGIQGFDEKLNARPKLDIEGAKKLMAEAGYGSGFDIQLDCPNDRYINDEKICQAVVPMLARIGIKVNLNAQTKAKWFDLWLNSNSSFYLNGWTSSTYDALNPMYGMLGTRNQTRGTFNGGRYSNPEVDKLLVDIQTEVDNTKRNALMDKVWAIMKDDVPVIPLHQQWLAWGSRQNIDTVLMPDDVVRFQWVTVK